MTCKKGIRSKKQLAVGLSKLIQIKGVDRGLEQYQTDSELAADLLWNVFMLGDIEGKKVYDLGCGNGVFGIGALWLGADNVVFVEKDKKAVEKLRKNLEEEEGGYLIIDGDIADLIADDDDRDGNKQDKNKQDCVVIMNPPFGTKKEHADRAFLERAFKLSDIVYSIHKAESKQFLESFARDNGFVLDKIWHGEFKIKKSHIKHKKDVHKVPIIIASIVRRFD